MRFLWGRHHSYIEAHVRALENYMEARNPKSPEEAREIIRDADFSEPVKERYIATEHFRKYIKKRESSP